MSSLELEPADPSERTLRKLRWPLAHIAAVIWGLALSIIVSRFFFAMGHGQFFENHESNGYGLRLIEFRDCLWNGYLLPQWCIHFRGGLGSPFFNYYQPGFFYIASLAPPSLPVAQQLGWAVIAFSITGYFGMYSLLAWRFGVGAGALAGTCLLTAPYIHTELYLRGDLSEYAAMMLVPGLLSALVRFCEQPSRSSGVIGAVAAAAVVLTHPAIALATYGLLMLALLAVAISVKKIAPAGRGATLLAFGVGLSAVYWLPVFLESRYSSVEKMWNGQIFDGYYHYTRHFVSLPWLFDNSVTKTPIPVKLGLLHTLVTGVGLSVMAMQWFRWEVEQRRVAGLCALVLMVSLFFMTPQSVWFWSHLPLLNRVQFPWRLLALVSLAMAGLAGVTVSGFRVHWQRRVVVAFLCGLLAWPSATRTSPKMTRHLEPRSASEIADHFFAPDLADEWLPRDARSYQISPSKRQPASNPQATINDYRIQQGVLTCELSTSEKSAIVLPHYFFPVGFTATINGKAVAIDRNPVGFIRVEVPAKFTGTLRVAWSLTRAKQAGLGISLATLFVGLFALAHPLSRARDIFLAFASNTLTGLASHTSDIGRR